MRRTEVLALTAWLGARRWVWEIKLRLILIRLREFDSIFISQMSTGIWKIIDGNGILKTEMR